MDITEPLNKGTLHVAYGVILNYIDVRCLYAVTPLAFVLSSLTKRGDLNRCHNIPTP